MRPPLLIVGFHRSGTSAIARMFHHAGVHMGDRLLGAEDANPHGHYEDIDGVALHDRFLQRRDQTWKSIDPGDSPLSSQSRAELSAYIERRRASSADERTLWGLKDPRLCLFLDDWLEMCPAAHVVLVFRRPGDAIASLHMRHSRRHVDLRGVDPSDTDFWRQQDLGLRLWVHYHERALAAIANARNPITVDFNDRASLGRLVARASDVWGLDLDRDGSGEPDPRLGTMSDRPIEVSSDELLQRTHTIWSELTQLVNVT